MQFNLVSAKSVSEWISLNPVQRVNLHPLFKSIEEYYCSVHYHPKLKCFYVEYDYNDPSRKYNKGILSNSITSIVDDVLSYYALA